MFFRPIPSETKQGESGGGVYPNLLCAPPFQIDGNLGFAAAIAEMLVCEENGEIKPLAALPKNIKSGAVRGLRIKKNRLVNLEWRDGEIVKFEIIN